jgi:MFS family permease
VSETQGKDKTSRTGVRHRLLSGRQFRWLLPAFLGSSTANGFLPVAESFGILKTTGSAGDLGLVLAVQAAVSLALSLFGGVAADRLPRARLLMGSAMVRLAAAATLATVLLTHTATLSWFIGVSVLYGGASALFGPASTALLPDVVARGDLREANALIGSGASLCWTVAPAIAGVVVAAFGPGMAFAVESALMALITLCLVLARIPAPGERGPAEADSVIDQLRQGWTEFRARRWLWLLTLQWTLFSLVLVAPLAVIGPTVAKDYLGGAAAWGAISACLAVGLVGAQFLAARFKPKRPVIFMGWLAPLGVVEALAMGLAAPVVVIAVMALCSGCALGLLNVFFQTSMQQGVPGEVLGRVAAFDLVASEVGQPIGYALAGPLGLVIGLRKLLVGCAALAAVGSAAFAVALSGAEQPDLESSHDHEAKHEESGVATA